MLSKLPLTEVLSILHKPEQMHYCTRKHRTPDCTIPFHLQDSKMHSISSTMQWVGWQFPFTQIQELTSTSSSPSLVINHKVRLRDSGSSCRHIFFSYYCLVIIFSKGNLHLCLTILHSKVQCQLLYIKVWTHMLNFWYKFFRRSRD